MPLDGAPRGELLSAPADDVIDWLTALVFRHVARRPASVRSVVAVVNLGGSEGTVNALFTDSKNFVPRNSRVSRGATFATSGFNQHSPTAQNLSEVYLTV